MATTKKQQILSRIYGRGRGWVFTPNDFIQDFKRWEISNTLEDLTNEGVIRRIIRGVYDYPLYSDLLKKYVVPDLTQVANALARKYNWRIQPTGDTSLTYLGLSTQVSSQYVFYSDGPAKKYDIQGQCLEFKHKTLKESSIEDKNTILVIQSIKSIGKENITNEFLDNLKSKFNEVEWKKIKKHSVKTVLWVQECINSIVASL